MGNAAVCSHKANKNRMTNATCVQNSYCSVRHADIKCHKMLNFLVTIITEVVANFMASQNHYWRREVTVHNKTAPPLNPAIPNTAKVFIVQGSALLTPFKKPQYKLAPCKLRHKKY